ncbi:MAG TPA: bifunctional phosphoribosylaminoimidazolecarboxamide formyltransferase/IMP cyclohydrolase [Bdellovibrionales bacterium]|nr:bifunctional phosphoribosylaminoimidazolecarboxamide formyltransferase/IMP cyclohydrolase [Bdellovibrionales bacterium]
MHTFKNALVSVSDKAGLAEFLKPHAERGLRIVSTGGTAKYLRENGFKVVEAAEQTGFPEVMDGRVRTLHPHIHMALLARSWAEEDLGLLRSRGLEPFDLVIGNLYPFEASLQDNEGERELVENIDIGGPALLRASAKSFERITVICDPKDYEWIREKSELTLEDRRMLASKVFAHVSSYDAMIANHFAGGHVHENYGWGGSLVQELRYGENAQQKAYWFRERGASFGLHDAKIIQGKPLSYNNILDLDAAVATVREFEETCAVGVKHNNPCGVATGTTAFESVNRALAADPVSIFGGIVACNRPIDADCAQALAKVFLECVIAPAYSAEALQILSSKKNLRLLEWPDLNRKPAGFEIRAVTGGALLQARDEIRAWDPTWKVIGEAPSKAVIDDLMFAWKVCAHLKSNAIALASDGVTRGLGMGQVNRVDAVKQALGRAKEHGGSTKGPLVMASDAFFPFPDSIEAAAAAGVKWVIQPGGSVKDPEVEEAAKRLRINMIMTGERHFRH